MKINKLLSVFAVSALALANLSAFDAKAKVTLEGSLVKETKEKEGDAKYEALTLDEIEDHSKNGIEIDVDAGAAGAHFEFFYDFTKITKNPGKAEDGWLTYARNTYIWFKPIDMIKVRLGYVGIKDFFVERIDEEKVGNPFSLTYRANDIVPYYITNADVDEIGFSLAVEPIENLMLSAAIAPGVGGSGISKSGSEDAVYSQWGFAASYAMNALKFQASFRDNGKEDWKVIRLGAGYESENLYAFIQPVFGLEYITSKDKYEMNGTCIDLYGEYKMDALKFTGHLPVTIRTTGKDEDPKYLEFLAKVEYNTGMHGLLDDVTPYVFVKNMDKTVVTLDDNASDYLALTTQLGTAFKVADAKIDVGLRIDVHGKKSIDGTDVTSEKITWSVPFTTKIEF